MNRLEDFLSPGSLTPEYRDSSLQVSGNTEAKLFANTW